MENHQLHQLAESVVNAMFVDQVGQAAEIACDSWLHLQPVLDKSMKLVWRQRHPASIAPRLSK